MNVILYNGRIYPQTPMRRRPSVVVLSGNAVAAVGHDPADMKRRFPRHRPVNLEGRAVIPGLVDSHTHLYFWAISLGAVHLDGIIDFSEALAKIGAFAGNLGSSDWVFGDGWSADRWRGYHLPTAAELDQVTGGRPAALFSKDQHILWVNSKALALAGINRATPDPAGGRIDRDPVTGEPTGILREIPGYFPVIKLVSRPDLQRIMKAWREATRIAHSRGVTGFHSMDGPEAWEFFTLMQSQKKLGFRVHYYFPVSKLDDLIAKRLVSGHGDRTLQVGGVKIFADGSLGAQTALMHKPYLGGRKGRGIETTALEDLIAYVGQASRHRLACAVHAIGDRAVGNVITAFEKAAREFSLRHRIEHLQLISRGDVTRLRKTGVIASMQPSHCPSDRALVAAYWGARGRNAFIFKTLLKRGIPLAFGSDCPIEPLDPLAGIHAAVNRTGCGQRGGRFYPEECLSVGEAVAGFTLGPAFASGRESFSGRIVPGYQADLVILDDDIYSMPKSAIYKAGISATIFEGRVVYRSSTAPHGL